MILEALLQYVDALMDIHAHPDYPAAANGLQVEGPEEVHRIAAAVDVSLETIQSAALLLVHHGLFWQGLRPLTGRRYRKVSALIHGGIGLYSAHLPLDAHPDLGNCVLLARAIALDVQGRFGEFEGAPIGWWGTSDGATPEAFLDRVSQVLGRPAQLLRGGDHPIRRVGVLTGSGGSFVDAAAREGLDALVTGEASHHTYVDAQELGVHVVLAGHYATETFGVKALAAHLADRFGLTWEFLDHPSDL